LNLRLSLDTRFQQATESVLVSEIELWNAYWGEMRYTSGVVIAMNPQTGEILSMVSWPSYENNRLARFIPAYYYRQLEADARKPLLNHAIGDELPAGSVFKLATALGCFE
jgi:penicillin-binding protein 2